MATITDFNSWLLVTVNESDYNDIYNLYCTIAYGEGQGCYEISNKNGMWFLKYITSSDTLMIASEKARQTLLSIIEHEYCGDMDIESFWSYHHALEKDKVKED